MPASAQQKCGDAEERHLRRLATYRKYRKGSETSQRRKQGRERMARLRAAMNEDQRERQRAVHARYREASLTAPVVRQRRKMLWQATPLNRAPKLDAIGPIRNLNQTLKRSKTTNGTCNELGVLPFPHNDRPAQHVRKMLILSDQGLTLLAAPLTSTLVLPRGLGNGNPIPFRRLSAPRPLPSLAPSTVEAAPAGRRDVTGVVGVVVGGSASPGCPRRRSQYRRGRARGLRRKTGGWRSPWSMLEQMVSLEDVRNERTYQASHHGDCAGPPVGGNCEFETDRECPKLA
ncbi:hypothetical protein C8R47DRAFT_1073120 [Mycena vitilis]|nr:hypothetical protein C8R47DRAFT_1073120 [Mycena vitilis]